MHPNEMSPKKNGQISSAPTENPTIKNWHSRKFVSADACKWNCDVRQHAQ
ncbi:hypothetical protein GG496_000417 [Candidatus Fervidibacteria bacterium JGI MDM2 JNZ-1-D12]